MALVLNPAFVMQNSLAMIGSLSCVEFLREVPLYLSGNEDSSAKLLYIKLIIAVIIVTTIMIFIFTYSASEHKSASATVPP